MAEQKTLEQRLNDLVDTVGNEMKAMSAEIQMLRDLIPYKEYQCGYVSREEFGFVPANNVLGFIPFPKSFSKRPDVFTAKLDIPGDLPRHHYTNKVTPEGFHIACNYAPDMKGVWYIAGVRK